MKVGGSPEAVVVGGGIVGAATAYELARLGTRVLMVDDRRKGRASDAGAGILSPETALHPDDHWRDLATAAGEHYRQLVSTLSDAGIEETGFTQCPLLRVALGDGELSFFEQEASRSHLRHPALERLDPAAAHRWFPPLGEVRAVQHNPRAARVDGAVLTAALVAAGQDLGMEVLDDQVVDFHTARSRVRAVRCRTKTVECESVALCGGAWSRALAQPLGSALPVTPLKGQIVHLYPPPPASGTHDVGTWPIIQPIVGHYVVPWPDGRVACGGTLEQQAGFDRTPTASGVAELLNECLRLAPGLAGARWGEVRVGLRPATPDGAPVLGALPGWDNVWVATGHGTDGLLLGPLSGRLVALEMSGESPALSLEPFSAARFLVR